MPLALSTTRHTGERFLDAGTTPLNSASCKIGRGTDCEIVLEDPTRHVSRVHATINRQGDAYVLSVDSQVNPVLFNENLLKAGQTVALAVGDQFAIGEYTFAVVSVEGESQGARRAAADLLGAPPHASGTGRSELDSLLDASTIKIGSVQPPRSPAIDGLIGGHSRPAEDPLLGILGGGPAGVPARAFEPAATGFDDPLMQFLGDGASSGHNSNTSAVAPVFAGHTPGGVASIDDLLGSDASMGTDPLGIGVPDHRTTKPGFGGGRGGSLELDHVHDINLPFSLPEARQAPARTAAPVGRPPSNTLLSMFDESSPDRAATAAGTFEVSSQDPTFIGRASAPNTARQARSASAAAGVSTAQAVQTFLQGAGMQDVQVSDADAEPFLRECGAVCRAAVDGLMGMLLARATVKDQLRVSDRTMISERENNPLKLIENVDEAVKYVFDRSFRTDAFLPPDKAVADACKDLQIHEIALVAGMRSALIGAIKRFNPATIEKRAEKAGGSSLLANKKAKLWDTFLAYYELSTRDAEDNFDRVFGPDFLRAYQEQLKRLKS